jgi:hypothetical protein
VRVLSKQEFKAMVLTAQRDRKERRARALMDLRGYHSDRGCRIRAGAFRSPVGMGRTRR